MKSQIFNRILKKLKRKIREFNEFISLEIHLDRQSEAIEKLVYQETKEKCHKQKLGIRLNENQYNTSHSAIIKARDRKRMFYIVVILRKISNVFCKREMQNARKELI